jgi:hypothetical protein
LHFQREHHAEACNLEEAKILEAEYREASGPWVLCLGHYSLLCHNHKNFERLHPVNVSTNQNHTFATNQNHAEGAPGSIFSLGLGFPLGP